MAYDKAVDSTALETGLTTIADAIRAKGGTSAPLEFPQGMADAVAAIECGGGGLQYKVGEFLLDSDETAITAVTVTHGLGAVPDLILVWTDEFVGVPVADIEYNLGFFWARNLCKLPQKLTSAASATSDNYCVSFTRLKNDDRITPRNPTSTAYMMSTKNLTDSTFALAASGRFAYWKGGTKYKFFVLKGVVV